MGRGIANTFWNSTFPFGFTCCIFSIMASPAISVRDLMGSVSDISNWLRKLKQKVSSVNRSLNALELMQICQEVEKSLICE